jgi:hypothetical protein
MKRPFHHGRPSLRRLAAWSLVAAIAFGAAPALAAQVLKVRVGDHPEYTRVVFELDRAAGYRVKRVGSDARPVLEITVDAATGRYRLGANGNVRGIAIDAGPQAVARIPLDKGDLRLQEMILSDPPRIVLDLVRPEKVAAKPAPKPAAKPAPAPKPAPIAKPAPEPTPIAVAPPVEEVAPPKPQDSAPPRPDVAPPKPTVAETPPSEPPLATLVRPEPAAPPAELPAPGEPADAPLAPSPSEIADATPALTPPSPAAIPSHPPVTPAAKPAPTPPPKPAQPLPTPAPVAKQGWLERIQSEPTWLAGIGAAGLALVALVFVLRRRGRKLPNDPDVAAIAEEIEEPGDEGHDVFGAVAEASDEDADVNDRSSLDRLFDAPASREPGPPRVAPLPPLQASPPKAPSVAPTASASDDDAMDSLFDDTQDGDLAAAETSEGDASMDPNMDLPSQHSGTPPSPPPSLGGSAAPGPDVSRLLQQLEQRIGALESKLDEANEAREKLERQVAAQSEELRVQRAAIARTQRALRTMSRGEEDKATEPALRDGDTQAKTRVNV